MNNPLQQYFRRPAVFIRLPSGGKNYAPGVINIPESGEFPVYPMTAIDEITSRTPDALFNGSAVADLIKSCVPDILQPWELQNTDLDSVLIGIKVASGTSDIELSSVCPACKEESNYSVNLMNVLSQLRAPNYDDEMTLNDLSIKFKPLTYKEMNEAGLAQFDIQKKFADISTETDDEVKAKKSQDLIKQLTDLTMKIIAGAIDHIRTPSTIVTDKGFIYEYLSNCDKDAYAAIRDHNTKLRDQTAIKPFHMKCQHCSHEYDQAFTLNTSDFFG